MSPFERAALAGLAVSGALAVATWVASVKQRDASLVDRTWSLLVAAPAAAYAAVLDPPWNLRTLAVASLLAAWAIRLAVYVTRRNRGHGEDPRYQAIRARNEPNFAVKSLYLVFGLQAVLAWSTENTKNGLSYDWNVDSSQNAFAAWSAMAHDPYFAAGA